MSGRKVWVGSPKDTEWQGVYTWERFIEKVGDADANGCWPWRGALSPSGYGAIFVGGRGYRAHRYSYDLFVGEIPVGLEIDHLCKVRHCVNPDHMEPVLSRENTLRGSGPTAVNSKKTHCDAGHPFVLENTRIDNKDGRRCRECKRADDRLYYSKNKAELNRKRYARALLRERAELERER